MQDRRDMIGAAGVAIVASVIWFARAPFATSHLWAEDGRNWLQDALQSGAIQGFGRADAGYYHFIPRVGGAIASIVPIGQAALAMWVFGAVVVAWLCATVYVSARRWIPNEIARAVLALALVLLPVQGEETIGSVANLHFLMLFVGLVVIIGEPRSTIERVNGWAVLVLLGLSTPITMALLPFAAWRLYRQRSWRPDGLTTAWIIGVVVQFGSILLFRPTRPASDGTGARSVGAQYVTNVVAGNFFPTDRAARAVGLLLGLAVVALIAVAVVAAVRRHDTDRVVLMIAVPIVGLGTYAVSAIGYGARFRYALFPALCLLWVGLCAVDVLLGDRRRSGSVTSNVVFASVAVLLLLAWLPHWSASEYRRSGPTWSDALDAAADKCTTTSASEVEVVISPTDLPPDRSWTVRVDCSDLKDFEHP